MMMPGAAGAAGAAPAAGGAGSLSHAGVAEEQTEFAVKLEGFDAWRRRSR